MGVLPDPDDDSFQKDPMADLAFQLADMSKPKTVFPKARDGRGRLIEPSFLAVRPKVADARIATQNSLLCALRTAILVEVLAKSSFSAVPMRRTDRFESIT